LAIEIRRLIVNKDELKQICSDYTASGDSGGPQGAVTELKFFKEDPFTVLVQIRTAEDQQTPFTLDEAHLISAFIGYCTTKTIPISRTAKKTVKKTENGMIAFDMVLQSTV